MFGGSSSPWWCACVYSWAPSPSSIAPATDGWCLCVVVAQLLLLHIRAELDNVRSIAVLNGHRYCLMVSRADQLRV